MSLQFYKENNLEKTADSIREINESNETYGISDTGVVDGELSETSENPVQNKIITAALNKNRQGTDCNGHFEKRNTSCRNF